MIFKREHLKIISVVVIIKIFILIFAVHSFQVVNNQPLTDNYWYWQLWRQWDAKHYLEIAQNGYTNQGENRYLIVYFPLFPLLIAFLNLIFGDYLFSSFVVSGIASIGVGLLFYEIVKLDFSEKIAELSVLFLFIFPTSYFLHIPYTESLFLALCLSCFLAARQRFWLIVGITGFLACLTRINGLFLFLAIIFEIWEEYKETKSINFKWLWITLIPIGFATYLALNYFITGNPTMFLTYQNEHWGRYLRFPWEGLYESYKALFNQEPNVFLMKGFYEIFFVLIGFLAIILGWKIFRNSYRVWLILNWLIFVSTSFVLSVPRYTLLLFPLFILMALASEKNWYAKITFTIWSILYLALFITQFIRKGWAF
jgi:Gpi18-like mannosyltransferase